MIGKAFSIIKKVVLWSYLRGTWQYDVLCILILAFIFLTPSSCFNKKPASASQPANTDVKSPGG